MCMQSLKGSLPLIPLGAFVEINLNSDLTSRAIKGFPLPLYLITNIFI